MTLSAAAAPPLEPDAPQAKQWLLDELAKPEYVQARPSWFDQLAVWLRDLLASLRPDPETGLPALGAVVLLGLVLAVGVVAFLVFGMPRLRRRSALGGPLFGEDDERSSAEMRRSALAAAAGGDYDTAVVELYRALARGLAERTIVTVTPGTTARDVAARASLAFPDERAALAEAADAFDGVRYLGRVAAFEQFAALRDLEGRLAAARPQLETARA